MFDVSFSELLVIAIVALLVIGPEKLPKVARTVGAFTGRMQRYVAQVKEEINREVRFEELQKLQQEIKQSVEDSSFKKAINSIEQETDTLRGSIHAASSDTKIKTTSVKPKSKEKKVVQKRVRVSNTEISTKTKVVKASSTKSNLVQSNIASAKVIKP